MMPAKYSGCPRSPAVRAALDRLNESGWLQVGWPHDVLALHVAPHVRLTVLEGDEERGFDCVARLARGGRAVLRHAFRVEGDGPMLPALLALTESVNHPRERGERADELCRAAGDCGERVLPAMVLAGRVIADAERARRRAAAALCC